MTENRATEPKIAGYDEVLSLLTEKARNGDVRAQIALASHLRGKLADAGKSTDPVDEFAKRRTARAS